MERLGYLCVLLIVGSCGAADYYGTSVGQLRMIQHKVAGHMYIADSDTIIIKDFVYDGAGPDAFFYIGTSGEPSSSGTIIADENGSMGVLGKYSGKKVVLNLPAGVTTSQIRWLSVWCKQFAVNFGDIMFPTSGLTIPAPVVLGQFSTLAHGVSSGDVTLVDDRTIMIKGLNYDGAGPDAFFWVGTTASPDTTGKIIADENGSKGILKKYSNADITLTLDADMSWRNIRWLSMWCRQFTQDFGNVMIVIPQNAAVPPYQMHTMQVKALDNCMQLHEQLTVSWEIDGSDVIIELAGALDDNGYMAFGISGSASSSVMINGDVAVCYYKDNDPQAEDYFLQGYSLCSGSSGVCPDTARDQNENLEVVSGSQKSGVTTVRYRRSLAAGDSETDKAIPASGDVYVIWAMGGLNSDGRVTKHDLKANGDVKVNFGQSPADSCTGVKVKDDSNIVPWKTSFLYGDENPTITARIGHTGGAKGYKAITGQQSWGIAWYLNGQLIPTLVVRRGDTITFKTEGGSDPANPAKYHPFYITDDKVGGYADKSAADRANVMVYAGVENKQATGVGRYCEYKITAASKVPEEYSTFEDFASTLKLDCDSGEPGTFTWTPDTSTPDVVYYQCYTHQYLGWKIMVVEDYDDFRRTINSATSHSGHVVAMVITLMLAAIF